MKHIFTCPGCRALDPEEVRRISAVLKDRDRAWFMVGIRTGFRITELLSVRIGDVWDGARVRDSLRIDAQKMKGRRNSRIVPLHPDARDALLTWILAGAPAMIPDAPVFAGPDGSALGRRAAHKILHTAARRAGVSVERLGTHSLRKTYASRLYAAPDIQGDLAKLARLLGHRNPANTLRYVDFLDGCLDAAVLSAL